MSSVTLSLMKMHLRVNEDSEDELIQLYIDAAECFFDNYTGRKVGDIDPVPADIRRAIVLLAAFYYEHREAASFGDAMRLAPFGVLNVANSYRERWFGEDAA